VPMAKVLVIDDEANVRTLINMLLTRLGYEVLLADNGQKGLELYRQEHPDVIVLDLRMPEMGGVEVLIQIRSVDLHQPVIIMTGDSRPEIEREIRTLGVSDFIVKGGSALRSLENTLKRLFPILTPFVKQNQQVIRDYLIDQFKGFEVTDMPNPPVVHLFIVTKSSVERYGLKVAWSQISDRNNTPATIKQLLVAHDVAGRMRATSQGEYFAWGSPWVRHVA
jgi:CheY-like chemotaxis protein